MQVAARLELSQSKIARIESGDVRITRSDLIQLLELYGVTDRAEIADFIEIARIARQVTPTENRDILSSAFRQYLEFEEIADRLKQFESALMPGLLQTPSYADAVLRTLNGVDLLEADEREEMEEKIARKVKIRAMRQDALFSGDEPTRTSFVLDEAVLRRQVGMEIASPMVMREQLAKVREMIANPAVGLSVIPSSRGAHPGMNGSFTILQFPDDDEDPIVYLEDSQREDAFIRDDISETGRYLSRFEYLQSRAVSGPELLDLLNAIESSYVPA